MRVNWYRMPHVDTPERRHKMPKNESLNSVVSQQCKMWCVMRKENSHECDDCVKWCCCLSWIEYARKPEVHDYYCFKGKSGEWLILLKSAPPKVCGRHTNFILFRQQHRHKRCDVLCFFFCRSIDRSSNKIWIITESSTISLSVWRSPWHAETYHWECCDLSTIPRREKNKQKQWEDLQLKSVMMSELNLLFYVLLFRALSQVRIRHK